MQEIIKPSYNQMFFKCNEIESMMNKAGIGRVPFLFGIDFEMENGFFLENPISQNSVLFELNGVGNVKEINLTKEPESKDIDNSYQFDVFPEEYSIYEEKFNKVKELLKRGDSFLTNLTTKTAITTSLSLEEIFYRSTTPYRLYIPDMFVCFSPECFVQIKDGNISTYPMKGTIDAAIPNADITILNDEKEKYEHNTIVDLMRNDLAQVSKNVNVKQFRYIDTLKSNRGNLLQVSSEIEGNMNIDYLNKIGTTIFKLLPAGSVSGAPKRATLNIIHNAENNKRGFYTGIAGYFDGETINSFVMIRYIEKEDDKLFFRSGGGITAMSDCEKEYREVLQKVYLPF